jgi:hypothetical protein
MRFAILILCAASLWHLAAAYHFTLFPGRTVARATSERPVSPIASELLRFLGGLNVALAALGILAASIYPQARPAALLALAIGNLSQALLDVRVMKAGLAKGPFFAQILVGDLLFTVLTTSAWVRLT